jgi:allophanate hydrolase
VPAGLNGIVGLKPSLGLLSSTGMVPACRTLDTISIFAATVDDALLVCRAAAGYDAGDGFSRPLPLPYAGAVPPALRVGVPLPAQREFFGDAAGAAAFEAALSRLQALGAVLVPFDLAPFHAVAHLLYDGPWVAERYAATRAVVEGKPEALHPVTRAIVESARRFSAADAFDGIYRLAALKRETAAIRAGFDVMAVPTLPRPYTVAEVMAEPFALNRNLGLYTNFVNLLDLAAIAFPAGLRADGLPASLTLIGAAGSDGFLAGIAAALGEGEQPDQAPRGAPEGMIELAVVGAHLSGMALNHELLGLGAVFLRAVRTRPEYKLFALETVPPKPGLLRVGEGAGMPVEAEVWALDPAAFGRFVAAIPAPLGIGKLAFTDGTTVSGFLVEAEAVRDARDISRYGGWRAYVAR